MKAFGIFMGYYIISGVTIGLLMAHFTGDVGGGIVLGFFMPFVGLLVLMIFVLIAIFCEENFS